jgi:cell division protein FtsB
MRSAWRRVAVLFVMTMLVLLFTAFYPYRQLQANRAELDQARRTLTEQERTRADLERQARDLEQPAEIERLARERFGLARPGEVPYIVVPEDQVPGGR